MAVLRELLRAVLWVLFALVALTSSLVYHLQLPLARNIARDFVNQFVSDEIRGELTIGRFDELTLEHVVARHVALFDGEGRRIIVADRVELEPQIKLHEGLIRFRVGRIYDSTVKLVDNGQDEPSLFTTFDAEKPSPPGTSDPLHVLVERVELHRATLYGQIVQLRGVRAENVEAVGRLEIGREVDVRIQSANGRMLRPFDFVGEIEALSGSVSTNTVLGVKLDVRARRKHTAPELDETLRAHLEYKSPAPGLPQVLELDLQSPSLDPDTLRRVDYAFAGPLAPRLSGDVRLTGPPEELALHASVDSSAGHADVTGIITSSSGLSVHVLSDGIEVAKLIPDGPAVRAKGRLHVAVGEEDDATPEVHAEIASMHYKGLLVPAFELDGTLGDDALQIQRAHALHGGEIALRGRVGFDGRSDLQLSAHFESVQRDPNLSQFAPNLEATLTAAVRIRTPATKRPSRLDISGKIALEAPRYGSFRADRISMDGSISGDPDLPNIDLRVQGEGVQVLAYRLGTARFSLRGGPPQYLAQGEFEAGGQKTFNFDAVVAADHKGFVVQADPIEFSVGDDSWRGAIRDLRVVNEESIQLGLLRLASRAQRLEASGMLRVEGEDSLQAQLQNFDVAALRGLVGASFPLTHGYADATVELQGDVERPTLSIQGALRDGHFPGFDPINALYAVSYVGGQLEFDGEVEIAERGQIELKGEGGLDADIPDPQQALLSGLYDLELTATNLDLTVIPGLTPIVRTGRVDGHLETQGGVGSITGVGKVSARDLGLFDWAPLAAASDFRYDYDTFSAQVHATDHVGALANAQLNWKFDWHQLLATPQTYARELLASDFNLRGRTFARAIDKLPVPVPEAAKLPLRVESTFELARSAGQLNGSLSGVARPYERLGDQGCDLSLDSLFHTTWLIANDRATLNYQALLDDRPVISGTGLVSWPFDGFMRGEPVSQRVSVDLRGQADLPEIARVPGLCRHGQGELHAQWDLRSLFDDSPRGTVQLRATGSPETHVMSGESERLVSACKTEPLALDLDVEADAALLRWQAKTSGCSGGKAQAHGSIPLRWGGANFSPALDPEREMLLQLSLRDAQLAPLLDHLPGVLGFSAKASGELSARALRGKVNWSGQISVADGRTYLIATGQQLRDVRLAMVANGNWWKLSDLHARAAPGTLEAAGGLGFEGFLPRRVQLALELRDFPLQREGLDLAWLTGGAAVSAQIEDARTQAAIKLHALSVRLPDASSRTPQSLDTHPDIALTTDPPKAKTDAAYRFAFVIDGRQRLTARRNDFEAELAAEVALEYQDPSLRVGGYVEFRRGTFDVFGKRFELNRGSMRFDGSEDLNPEVSLVATHQPDAAGASPVIVNVSGTLEEPEVQFHSDQCPGEGAVVLLVSGRCPSESDSATGDASGAQDAFAAGIIGGILTLGAQRQLGALIPRLAVESSARGTRTRVKAGFEAVPKFMRPLVQRVYVQGALSTSDSSATGETSSSGSTTPDFLLELYFPNSIIGAGRVAPKSWSLDVTWEP